MNLSITKAAQGLDVSRKTLSEIVNENAGIAAEIALRLEKGFGVDAAFWLEMQAKYDLWKAQNCGGVVRIHRIAPNKAE